MVEPTDESFIKGHVFYRDEHRTEELDLNLPTRNIDKPKHKRHLSSAFFHLAGQYDVDPENKQKLPNRFAEGSAKAKIGWFSSLFVAGVGMFIEAFIIITTGQIKMIWHDQFPECWIPSEDQHCPQKITCCGLFPNTPEDLSCVLAAKNTDTCSEDGRYPATDRCDTPFVLGTISYSEFAGIMCGMVVFGVICDRIGRKRTGLTSSLLMLVGISGMTFIDTNYASKLFGIFAVFFFIFGFGVGAEYPLTATGAAEHHALDQDASEMDDDERHQYRLLVDKAKTVRRGETISLVFSMQGLGAVFGSFVLLCLVFFSNQTRVDCDAVSSNSTGNDPNALSGIWRSFYFIGGFFVFMLVMYRYILQEEGEGHEKLLARKEKREARLGKHVNTIRNLFFTKGSPFLFRLLGTGGSWFVADIAFYGLKLFSGPIFDQINPGGDLVVQNGWLLVNNLISLLGYYAAAYVIDKKSIGRKKLQMFGFGTTMILFACSAAALETAPDSVNMILFFASSFFVNFGPNVTAYVMAAETYPTELRGVMHGASSFLGKAGALFATVVFSNLSTRVIFVVCSISSLVGLVFTALFSLDLTSVSLTEHDAQLELLLEGKIEEYKGKLNAPEHLGGFEKWTGRHGEYDPSWVSKLVASCNQDGGDAEDSEYSQTLDETTAHTKQSSGGSTVWSEIARMGGWYIGRRISES